MNAIDRFLTAWIDKELRSLHVAIPCRVISFDGKTATVQPLVKVDGAEQPVIQDVSALGQRLEVDGVERVYKPALKNGDVVLVVCCDTDIQRSSSGKSASPATSRKHDINDAVIVGVFPCSL
ncbi:hypothetical protein E0485_15220 [Paenibacillus albiflavus]|uniref:Phage protein Gp138 N-terminal domain-containing protein n=1 Tax=Paenibacillus albiflavus TaxID=2545760 RepID=A0A4R4EDV5_9BACL|nr:Gp138 family membrane-puncturing spike protein [Paenibacillus albiflavus]TCZ76185.1 hypothetical protein E0485_15220 [Paenibacillus albiflavus]